MAKRRAWELAVGRASLMARVARESLDCGIINPIPVTSSISRHTIMLYDDFPDGIEVSADSYQVDYHAPISVISARAATKKTYHHGLGNRVFRYVAVSFRSGSGDIIWTNFSRNGFVWMVPLSEPRCFHTYVA